MYPSGPWIGIWGYAQLKEQLACCRQNPNDLTALKAAAQTQQKMEILRKCLSEWHGGRTEYHYR